jgi:tetratricopeptide (TPR) repeat protein
MQGGAAAAAAVGNTAGDFACGEPHRAAFGLTDGAPATPPLEEDHRGEQNARGRRGPTMTWPPALPSGRVLLLAGLAVVVVALAAVGGWLWWDAEQRRILGAHAEVIARVPPALAPDATAEVRQTAMRDLEQLLARYPSARTVPEAAYELGNVRFAAGQYAAARTAYELALERGATGLVRTLARAALARTWEAERDFGRAAEAYGALARDLEPRSFLFEDALMDQARTLELAGKKDDAIATYQRMLKEVPTTRRAEDVRSRLASLGVNAR